MSNVNSEENYNQLMKQIDKLRYKLHELYFMFDESDVKIQMSKATSFSMSMSLQKYSSYQVKGCEMFNKLAGFDVETDDNLKDWEINVKFKDTYITNPDGTTTRITNYINLNDIDKLQYVPSWTNCSRTIL